MTAIAGNGGGLALAEFIRSHHGTILAAWEKRARALSPASRLSRTELRDHLPHVVERIAELAELAEGSGELPVEEAERHAVDRLQEGYDLSDVVREYSLLREVLLEEAAGAGVPGLAGVRLLNHVLDYATNVSVQRFSQASQRLLKALDRISTEALAAKSNLTELLERLLQVMMEASSAVDTASILLREGDRLWTRAAVGLTGERDAGFSLALGEGFVGVIAAEGTPRKVRDASKDPLIKSPYIRDSGVRGLYGVPLMATEVIGVAHMGSRTAFEFSDEDMLLFRAMANRATAFIVEAQLRDQAERRAAELEAVLESIPDGVYVGDSSGVKHVNRKGYELLGYSSSEGPKQPLDSLVREIQVRHAATGEVMPVEAQPFYRAVHGETLAAEVVIRRMDTGEDRCLRTVAAPVRLRGAIIGAVAVNTDITERKTAERLLRSEAVYRERFIGILGHDLRTPVQAIAMAADLLLKQDSITDGAARIVRRIVSSTARISRMIADLFDFSRVRSGGRLPLSPTLVDLGSCARLVVEELALAHPGREVKVAVEGDALGMWDGDRLAQLISNLVANALQHSPPESPVTVRVRGERAAVVLQVTNQGEPITEALYAQLFEPFRRGDSPEQRHRSGLGLGLFIARSIVDAHGGRIDVTSAGRETSFTVQLPRRPG
jgi:PAS domain S-box-containing protein